ncbi:flavoprotein [Plantactinospora siamensis]|uniref:Flavoprotein n=1 Tax=Plantactinospora siamensis TaxID=555372 RepID=A0ABV6NTK0_9ACTN
MTGHLQVVVCGAGPATDVLQLTQIAGTRGWTVAITATPNAQDFIDSAAVEAATGSPVRSSYRPSSGARRTLPPADALVIAPATYNSINKIALGLADNYAMTSIAELIGRKVPTVIVPFVNAALAARAPFLRAVAALRDEGIHILLGPQDGWEPHPPGSGSERQKAFPWAAAFGTAVELVQGAGSTMSGRP